jgi:hypothetical protein
MLLQLEMEVGTVKKIKIPLEDVVMSRKGIVDLYHLSGDEWQLTGLRQGFVILKGGDSEISDFRAHINVVGNREKRHAKDLPDWICKTEGIICNEQGVVLGLSADLKWYQTVERYCSLSRCLNQVEMKAEALTVWKDRWVQVLKLQGVELDMVDDKLVAKVDCRSQTLNDWRSYLDFFSSGLVLDKMLWVRCYGDEAKQYRLKSKVFLLDMSRQESKGLASKIDGMIQLNPTKGSVGFEAELENLLRSNQISVIASPFTRVLNGQAATIGSGGERPYLIHELEEKKGAQHVMLEYGVDLKFEIFGIAENNVRINYLFKIKNPIHDGSRSSFAVNRSEGELVLSLNHPTIVTSIDVRSQLNAEQQPFLLHSLPILGPIFKSRTNGDHHIKLIFWLLIDNDHQSANTDEGMTKFPDGGA